MRPLHRNIIDMNPGRLSIIIIYASWLQIANQDGTAAYKDWQAMMIILLLIPAAARINASRQKVNPSALR